MATKKKAKKISKAPRAQRLPGMEDNKLADLHSTAEDYADIRDQRQALTKQEVALKESLLALMHKHKLEHYEYANVEVNVVPEAETVKVKIRKQDVEGSEETEE